MSKKVFIGVGHGGSDPGAVSYIKEANANLTMAFACKEVLEANGVQVKMSRTKDENDPVAQEVKEANASGADLAVSIHTNAGGGDGWEAFCNPKNADGMRLAKLSEKHVWLMFFNEFMYLFMNFFVIKISALNWYAFEECHHLIK